MALIDCEIKIILTCCDNGMVTNATENSEFATTGTKVYVPALSLSTKNRK